MSIYMYMYILHMRHPYCTVGEKRGSMLLLFRSYQVMGMIDSHGCYFV